MARVDQQTGCNRELFSELTESRSLGNLNAIGSSFQSSLNPRSPSNLYAIGSSLQNSLNPRSCNKLSVIGSSFQSSLNARSLSKLYAIGSSFQSSLKPRVEVELTHHALPTEPTEVAYLCPLLLLAVFFCL